MSDAIGEQVVVGASRGHDPRALVPVLPWTLDQHVAVGEGECGRALDAVVPGSVTVLDQQDGRQAIAVLRRKGARRELELLDGLGIEGAGETEEAIGVVDLDAVHDGEILVRCSSAHREARAELVGGRHPGQGLQRPEDVVDRARDLQHLLGRARESKRARGRPSETPNTSTRSSRFTGRIDAAESRWRAIPPPTPCAPPRCWPGAFRAEAIGRRPSRRTVNCPRRIGDHDGSSRRTSTPDEGLAGDAVPDLAADVAGVGSAGSARLPARPRTSRMPASEAARFRLRR